jgi:hypothetical protein
MLARKVYMMESRSKCGRFGWIGLAVVVVAMAFSSPAVAADDGSDGATLEKRIGEVFYRSMAHWRYDYSKIPDRKAGVACIPWERLDTEFLESDIFEALGFSYSMADDEGAIRVATQGCNQMRAHYKVTDCACELVLIGETVVVVVPEGVRE